jgi:hypothetical protein
MYNRSRANISQQNLLKSIMIQNVNLETYANTRNIPQQAIEPCETKKAHHHGCPAPLTGNFAPKHNTYQKEVGRSWSCNPKMHVLLLVK